MGPVRSESRSVKGLRALHAAVLSLHPASRQSDELLLRGHPDQFLATRTPLEFAAAVGATKRVPGDLARAVGALPRLLLHCCRRRCIRWSRVVCPLESIPVPDLVRITVVVPACGRVGLRCHGFSVARSSGGGSTHTTHGQVSAKGFHDQNHSSDPPLWTISPADLTFRTSR